LRRGLKEGALLIFGFVAVYLLIALLSYHPNDPGWSHSGTGASLRNLGGPAGAWFADIFLSLFGFMAYLFPIMVGYAGWLLFRGLRLDQPLDMRGIVLRAGGFLLTLATGCGLASLHDALSGGMLPVGAGGMLGDTVSNVMEGAFSFLGATLLMLAGFLSGVTLFTNLSWLRLMDVTGSATLRFFDAIRRSFLGMGNWFSNRRARRLHEERSREQVEKIKIERERRSPPRIEPVVQRVPKSERVEREKQVPLFEIESDGELPPLSLLDQADHSGSSISNDVLEVMSRQVELKLQDFGISAEVVAVHPGPVITRFELQPAPGVKVSQITNLAKDLARALSAISVRIVDVIPGKPTIGLEVPNEVRETVRLSETLQSKAFEEAAASPLTLALGKDISGVPVVADLAKMPHLLVAGTTGAGKSVALNAMLLSILYNASPEQVRLILIDPKMLELSIYDGIPHLLAPVVTDMKEAANAFRWCVAEMERRYRLMAALKVRNINGFNRKVAEASEAGEPIKDPLHVPQGEDDLPTDLTPLPYIVLVVDELADMMMLVGKKVEELIARLAQKARASGIHLILATQRPSVDVLTGLIKANIPTRIAFQVSARADSRTILDQIGAEQLLGHGDMLYLPPGTAVPTRVHGAFVADHEVHRVVDDLKQRGRPAYIEDVLMEKSESEGSAAGGGMEDAEQDPLYDQAVQIVIETRKASISGVQRRLKIGYNRAARIVEAMEAAGLVGPLESNGSREVLVPPPAKD
jgi:S-DNA-T family DNA segregation ATPase FtsK/SpoIIIE